MCEPLSLHQAINSNNYRSVKTLLKEGVDVNLRDEKDRTPLLIALERRRKKLVKLLLKYGADVNAGDIDGIIPLELAIEWGSEEIVENLLDKKADVNAECTNHQTPLLLAAAAGERYGLQICGLLFKYGADVNVTDREGNTPLLLAFQACQPTLVDYLLDIGSDVHITSDFWGIPFRDTRDHRDICEYLWGKIHTHVIKLKAASLHVNDENPFIRRSFSSEPTCAYLFGRHGYEYKCREELERIKRRILGKNISLYHILTTKNPRYVLNKALVEDLEQFDHIEFPTYGTMILSKSKSDQRRFSLFETCKRAFSILMKRAGGITLPGETLERIFIELENRDLRNLALCIGSKQSN